MAHEFAPVTGKASTAGQTGLTITLQVNPHQARVLQALASKSPTLVTITETHGEVILPALMASNMASLVELGGATAWPCFTAEMQAVLIARKVVVMQ